MSNELLWLALEYSHLITKRPAASPGIIPVESTTNQCYQGSRKRGIGYGNVTIGTSPELRFVVISTIRVFKESVA